MPSPTPGSRGASRLALGLWLLLSPLSAGAEPWRFDLPPGFPAPQVPADNPMSRAKVELGRRLFSDPRLSVTEHYSCASCHDPARAFTDGRARAVGATGQVHPRAAMSLWNVAYQASFGWVDDSLRSLEDQAAVPMLSTHPIELGLAGRENEVMKRLLASERGAFRAAFPNAHRFDLSHVRKALAAYQRTLFSADSAYDRYVFQDERSALSAAARRGMALFFSARTRCGVCHPAPLFTSPVVYEGTQAEPRLHDVGLRDAEGHTRFRTPTLRNLLATAPYMHDGSMATLDAVIRHYARGGRDHRGVDLEPFEIRDAEIADLVAFLASLDGSAATGLTPPALPQANLE